MQSRSVHIPLGTNSMSNLHNDERIDRRTVLARGGAAALSATCLIRAATAFAGDVDSKSEATEKQIRDFLRPLLLAGDDVDLWFKRQDFPFCKYDGELG